MKNLKVVFFLATTTLLAGCHTQSRSISHSDYHGSGRGSDYAARSNGSDPGFEYRGELSEFDVLGITRGGVASDTEIEQALAKAKSVRLQRNSTILLVQSGAMFPDGPMVAELSRYFRVVPFSGVPPVSQMPASGRFESGYAEGYSRSLRLAAARGGDDVILCYWGILESENAKLATKTVSWVPVMNWFVPDEKEHMRVRLKMALVDVRTGNWSVLSPAPVDDARLSTSPRRGVADRKLVENLKQKAYATGAKELLRQYSDIALRN